MSKQAILERERRWALPAAIVAFAAVALLIASFVSRAQIPASSNLSDQVLSYNDHPGALVFSSVLSAIGFALFAVPLTFLFSAARARSERVQPALIALCVIGPVLIGVQGVINGIGLKNVGGEYAALAKEDARTVVQFKKDLNAKPAEIASVDIYTDRNAIEVETKRGDFYAVDYPQADEADLIGAKDASDVDERSVIGRSTVDASITSDGKIGDARATSVADDNSTVTLATNLIFPAALAMIVGVIYTALQAYRVGLLTRFFGTLGMALGAALILLPQAPVFLALWLGWLGLIFVGRVPGGQPPAWAAGEAVPWPSPGEQQRRRGRDDAIDGSGRETDSENGSGTPSTQTPKRKRKRRR